MKLVSMHINAIIPLFFPIRKRKRKTCKCTFKKLAMLWIGAEVETIAGELVN
jgi:hypothetical protein